MMSGRTSARRTLTTAAAAFAVLVSATALAVAQVDAGPPQGLVAVGPTSSEHGFPVWYEDGNGVRLEQCLDIEDLYCDPVFLAGEMPDGTVPMSFPDNFPMESFYFAAGSTMDTDVGKASFVGALEATWANGDVRDGDQVVFGRVRFDLDLPHAGTYTVTHPFGKDTFTVTDDEATGFRYVEDITPSPGNFTLAMRSRVSPFLTWDTGPIVTPDGNTYVGDPALEHKVTGSALGTNVFRLEGPDVGGPGIDVVETDLFNIMGKVATNSGVTAHKAVLSATSDQTYLDVFAEADAGDSVAVSGVGLAETFLVADGTSYFARVPITGPAPTSVTVTNTSDVPASTQEVPVSDEVLVSQAVYDTGTRDLLVTATSTSGAALSLPDMGTDLVDGSARISLAAPPPSITVRSGRGGSATAPVTVVGAGLGTPPAVVAVATGPSYVATGSGTVTLDASASLNATSYVWHEPEGQNLGVEGATTPTASFAAPTAPAQLEFWVTATGAAGSDDSDHIVVAVVETLPDPEPVEAVAIASPANPMVGQQVTVSGRESLHARTYTWSQVSGEGVPLPSGTETDTFSFVMPRTQEPVVLSLTVGRDPGEQDSTVLTITPVIDDLEVVVAQFRTDKNEWRVGGTSTIWLNNTVTVYQQNADGTRGPELASGAVAGPVAPETLGDWGIRVRGTPPLTGSTRLWIESSRGGVVKDVVYTTRS